MSKTALITGATSGIGKATRNLSKNNYKIILCGRREDRMVERNFQRTDKYIPTFDVRRKAVSESIAFEAFSTIDILINNAVTHMA
jgi:NADP-dependent 3-hydroxy acid dehydrogenase YdfG